MTKKQHYMTWDERQKLEAYYNVSRFSVSKIAELMGFNRQTIYNELALGAYMHTYDFYERKQYSAQKAQELHDWKQAAKGRPEKIGNNHKLADYIEYRILFNPLLHSVEIFRINDVFKPFLQDNSPNKSSISLY